MEKIPHFRAAYCDKDEIPCPWCNSEEKIFDNPSKWIPSHSEGEYDDYDDKESKCKTCGETFWVSVETHIRWDWTVRYAPWDKFDVNQETLNSRKKLP